MIASSMDTGTTRTVTLRTKGTRSGGVRIDGLVVAGGRSSRLDGTPKATLRLARGSGDSLVETTLAALHAHGAENIVVVGPEDLPLPETVLRTREDPPFSGPAAAVAAGLERLRAASSGSGPGTSTGTYTSSILGSGSGSGTGSGSGQVVGQASERERNEWTAVLACDMPNAAYALEALTECAAHVNDSVDGIMAVSESGHQENLTVLVRTAALEKAFHGENPQDRALRFFWKQLTWHLEPVPALSTQDVDTWEDVREFDLH